MLWFRLLLAMVTPSGTKQATSSQQDFLLSTMPQCSDLGSLKGTLFTKDILGLPRI